MQKLQVRLWSALFQKSEERRMVMRNGGRFVLGQKTKKDAFWSHAMLELKVKQKVYICTTLRQSCIRLFQCQMFGTRLVTSCVGII